MTVFGGANNVIVLITPLSRKKTGRKKNALGILQPVGKTKGRKVVLQRINKYLIDNRTDNIYHMRIKNESQRYIHNLLCYFSILSFCYNETELKNNY